MARRKQNLILFFEENEDYGVINSRLVRMYMNRFSIDEDDQTEVTEVYNIENGTLKEYQECFVKSLRIERENEIENTDTHWIIGSSRKYLDKRSSVTLDSHLLNTTSLRFKLSRLIANHRSRLGNGHAVTILSGSISDKFVTDNNQRIAHQYQNQQNHQKSVWWKIVHAGIWVIVNERINDDLEQFQSRIIDSGINNMNQEYESINTFLFQMLSDNQVENLKKSMSKFKRFYVDYSMKKACSNDIYVRFNCTRVTLYINNETNEFFMSIIFLLVSVGLIYLYIRTLLSRLNSADDSDRIHDLRELRKLKYLDEISLFLLKKYEDIFKNNL